VRGGKIVRLLDGPGAVRRCARGEGLRALDLGDAVLVPGFVDAHAHLELTGLGGKLPRRGSFADWIRALIRERAGLEPHDVRSGVRRGARRLLAGGTTAVGDIDSSGAAESALGRTPLRARVYREALDAGDLARGDAALARVGRAFAPVAAARARVLPGLSPHAPYTVGEPLLRALRALSVRRGWPVAVHWAETEEETAWLARGQGPFAELLPPRAPAKDGLSMLHAAGLLSRRLALVHGNHPRRGDRELVARARAVLVHCPGTHAFFRRAPFDLAAWLRAGVTIALGTDGLSSNADLDLRREMALLRGANPWIEPARVLEMATTAGARAIGLEGAIGRLAPRACADVCAHAFPSASAAEMRDPRRLVDLLTSGRSSVVAAWIGGTRVRTDFSPPPSESRAGTAE
jgi:cytosine/adenosine deaminase-related metal-dependent hydrolase